jgi:hypothetical protein
MLWPPGGKDCGSGDVTGLFSNLTDAAPHDIVDDSGIEAGSLGERSEDHRAEVGWMCVGEPSFPFPDRAS